MPDSASLILSQKLVLADGAIIQIRIWQLPQATIERPHGLKYSLFFGRPGERIIGYDNETGKGDHKHRRNRELSYRFSSVEQLVADFMADVLEELEK